MVDGPRDKIKDAPDTTKSTFSGKRHQNFQTVLYQSMPCVEETWRQNPATFIIEIYLYWVVFMTEKLCAMLSLHIAYFPML